jgi:hypothetical protein
VKLVILKKGKRNTKRGSELLATDPEARVRFPPLPKKKLGLKRGPLSLLSTADEILDRKVEAPV